MYWVNDFTSVGTQIPEDARLIAAAPALYEALVGMVRLSQMGLEESLREPEESGNFAAFNRAVAALKQARGEA